MSVPAVSSPFDLGVLPRHVADAVWRGCEVGGATARTVPTGFGALDAQLPGGGWPTHSLTELLLPQAALCEWRLLGPALPALVQSGGRIYLIAPPKQPYAPGLAQLGVSADQLIWVRTTTPMDGLWVTEQIVKSDPTGAVLSWRPQARPEQIRRLQIHAQSCDAPVFLFRPVTALHDASPAPLRVCAALADGWQLEVRIPKRRGASFDEPLHLAAMPLNLEGVLPPRLRTLPAPTAAPSRKESSDARALGRVASPFPAAEPLSY